MGRLKRSRDECAGNCGGVDACVKVWPQRIVFIVQSPRAFLNTTQVSFEPFKKKKQCIASTILSVAEAITITLSR